MSAGGVFKLIANDGKADRMLMASELLVSRIKDILCMRARQGFKDPTPTLVDLERTHILHFNAHFKPFAAIGFEYNKVAPQTANAGFSQGGSVTFSIPQFGDFFNDMVVRATLGAVSCNSVALPALTINNGVSTYRDTLTGSDISVTSGPLVLGNSIVSSRPTASSLAAQGELVRFTVDYCDVKGDAITFGTQAANAVRYCEFPGLRLLKKVQFTVNGNPIDDYTPEASVFHTKFKVLPHKLNGWKRLVGQEVPVTGFSDLEAVAGSSFYNSKTATAALNSGARVVSSAQPATVNARRMVQVVSGPQTPAQTQPQLDLWIPLLFWFNKDHKLSIASVSIPYGQRYIIVDLEQQSNIVFTAPSSGVFLRTTMEHCIYPAGTVVNVLPDGTSPGFTEYKKTVNVSPFLVPGSTVNTAQSINLELYINNIFVNPEIHDIYIRRIGFSLIRVHRFQADNVSTSSENKLLSLFKWPIEYIFYGIRPTFNISPNNLNQHRDWHNFTLLTDSFLDISDRSSGVVPLDVRGPVATTGLTSPFAYKFSANQQGQRITFPVVTQTVDTIQVQAHGIDIYKDYAAKFYNSYIPYVFGKEKIVTPEDIGCHFINFCLDPEEYQPSGHINVSRAREFYIQYTSSYVSTSNTASAIAVAQAINFLLISDGSAVLRYST